MLLASIVPISLLTYLPSDFSAYLALSDLVLESTAYERYYRDKSDLGRLVILDSPVHENVPLDELAWASAVSLVKPSVIVLPDVIDSSDQTVRNALRYASVARRLSPYSQLMGVGHGETTEEFLECSVQLRRTVGVDWLGVSLERRLNDDKLALKRRTERIQALRRNIDTRPAKIHLLGLSEEGTELNSKFFQDCCESVDTSEFAVWYLSGDPVKPPVPISKEYPGRKIFGGSIQYFYHRPPVRSLDSFRENLADWAAYADRKEVL